MFMVLAQANGRDSPQDCPFDRLRNTADLFRNCSGTNDCPHTRTDSLAFRGHLAGFFCPGLRAGVAQGHPFSRWSRERKDFRRQTFGFVRGIASEPERSSHFHGEIPVDAIRWSSVPLVLSRRSTLCPCGAGLRSGVWKEFHSACLNMSSLSVANVRRLILQHNFRSTTSAAQLPQHSAALSCCRAAVSFLLNPARYPLPGRDSGSL
jgi:hypothetical protein